jgi:hypothetical protein
LNLIRVVTRPHDLVLSKIFVTIRHEPSLASSVPVSGGAVKQLLRAHIDECAFLDLVNTFNGGSGSKGIATGAFTLVLN